MYRLPLILLKITAFLYFGVAIADATKYQYTLQKGELSVFGYILLSPDIVEPANENEEAGYYISFAESQDKERVLIIYDRPFDRAVVWLHDKDAKRSPKRIDTPRLGRHFGAEWHGNRVFALYGAGMGYKISRLFRVDDLNSFTEIEQLLKFDIETEIYASLEFTKERNFYVIVGRAFTADTKVEKYPLPLYSRFPVDAVDYIQKLEFTDDGLTITFTNTEEKTVTKTYQSKLIENGKV